MVHIYLELGKGFEYTTKSDKIINFMDETSMIPRPCLIILIRHNVSYSIILVLLYRKYFMFRTNKHIRDSHSPCHIAKLKLFKCAV